MTSRCYVSMSLGTKNGVDFDRVRSSLVAPALERCGYEPIAPDDLFSNLSVMDVAVRLIAESELMIADISIHNANVFHEIGIRQALLPTGLLFIRCRSDEIPFNLRGFFTSNMTLKRRISPLIDLFGQSIESPKTRTRILYTAWPGTRVTTRSIGLLFRNFMLLRHMNARYLS
jgi:hypothetical protein